MELSYCVDTSAPDCSINTWPLIFGKWPDSANSRSCAGSFPDGMPPSARSGDTERLNAHRAEVAEALGLKAARRHPAAEPWFERSPFQPAHEQEAVLMVQGGGQNALQILDGLFVQPVGQPDHPSAGRIYLERREQHIAELGIVQRPRVGSLHEPARH